MQGYQVTNVALTWQLWHL